MKTVHNAGKKNGFTQTRLLRMHNIIYYTEWIYCSRDTVCEYLCLCVSVSRCPVAARGVPCNVCIMLQHVQFNEI